MFDHQAITLNTTKSTPNLAHLTHTHSTKAWEWYAMEGAEPLKVGYSSLRRELVVKGSIPYFGQGHNATHSPAALRESWKYVGERLGVNPFLGYVTAFEFGAIVEIPFPVAVLLQHHTRLPQFKTKDFYSKSGKLEGKEFHSQHLKVKLYDPLSNFKAKRLTKSAYTQQLGLSPGMHYFKVENHYKQPEQHFKQRILLTDFFAPAIQQLCKTDLMETYQRIIKTKAVTLPNDKAKLSTGNIVLATLQTLAMELGISAEEMICNTLSRIPSDVLTKDDRKARKKQLRKMLDEVSVQDSVSPFDLSETLHRALMNYD